MVGDDRVRLEREGLDDLVRFLPGVAFRIVEYVRPLFRIPEAVAVRMRCLRGRRPTERHRGCHKEDSNHGMIIV